MSDGDSMSGAGDERRAPTRLVETPGPPGETESPERRAGALLRRVKPPVALSAAGLARVRMRLDGSIRPTSAGRRWAPAVVWMFVGGLILLGSGVVGAARGWVPSWRPLLSVLLPRQTAPASSDERPRHRAPDRSGSMPAAAPATPPAREEPPLSAPTVSPPPISSSGPPRRRPVAAGEGALLERAVMALRRKRDPDRALSLLDDYDARFSTGVLAPEAARLRIDALLLAGQRRRALDRLNALILSEGSRDLELGLIRGELRAGAGDCARAIGDFQRVLSLTGDGPMNRRAQLGRASCVRVAPPANE